MARRIVTNEDELAEFVDQVITSAAEDGVLQEAIDNGELVLNVPRAKHDDNDDEDEEHFDDDGVEDELAENESDDDYLDLPTYDNARFGQPQHNLSAEHPIAAKLKGRKVKQPPVYNSDDDDDVLDLPHFDNAAFGKW
jgi:hypothetical protein